MSDAYAKLLDELTQPLRMDPELRLEISRELQQHLEDCEADFVRAGRPADECRDLAIKALGDPTHLSRELWNANRSRIRLRCWVRRVVLTAIWPLAVIVALYPFWGLMASSPSLWWTVDADPQVFQVARYPQYLPTRMLIDHNDVLSRIPSSVLHTYFENSELGSGIESLQATYPEDPVYQAQLALDLATDTRLDIDNMSTASWNAATDPDHPLFKVLARGRTMDPDNALWDMIEAGLLMQAALPWFYDVKDMTDHSYHHVTTHRNPDHDGSKRWRTAEAYEPLRRGYTTKDQAIYDLGIAALDRALEQNRLINPGAIVRQRLEQHLPQPHDYVSMLSLMSLHSKMPRGHRLVTFFRNAIFARLLDQSIALAEAGDIEQAQNLLERLQLGMNMLHTTHADDWISTAILLAMERELAKYQSAVAQRKDPAIDITTSLESQYVIIADQGALFYQPADFDGDAFMTRPLLLQFMQPGQIGPHQLDYFDQAEAALIQRLLLSPMLLIFCLMAGLLGLANLWIVASCRSCSRPPLLWIGWTALARVLGCGVVLPMALYASIVVLVPAARFHFSNTFLERLNSPDGAWILSGPIALLMLMLTLALGLGAHAIARRARELGLLDNDPALRPGPKMPAAPRWLWAVRVVMPAGLVASIWHLPRPFDFSANEVTMLILISMAWVTIECVHYLLRTRRKPAMMQSVRWLCVMLTMVFAMVLLVTASIPEPFVMTITLILLAAVAIPWLLIECAVCILRGITRWTGTAVALQRLDGSVLMRAIFPIIAAAAILASVLGYGSTYAIERWAIAQMTPQFNTRAHFYDAGLTTFRDRAIHRLATPHAIVREASDPRGEASGRHDD